MTLPFAHVAGAFAPIEVIPITVAGGPLLAPGDGRSPGTAGRCRSGARSASASGLLVIAVALFSPIGHISEELVIAHMGEHLLIGDIATLLLVLGLTRLAAAADPRDPRSSTASRSSPTRRVAFPLWALNLFFWHVPAIYDAAYGTAPLHALEHTTFLFFGCLMWMPVFGPLPKPEWFSAGWKVGYVIAVRFTGAILGNVLMWSGSVLYPIYAPGRALLGDLAARRPEHGGRDHDGRGDLPRPRRARLGLLRGRPRRDREAAPARPRRSEHGVELDERRAQRAVAAGHGALLEQRLLAGRPGSR